MGVPKFFRYISERYPNLSELVGIKEVSWVLFFSACLATIYFLGNHYVTRIPRTWPLNCDAQFLHICVFSFVFQLPQFDNMYLDMNGIIHVCSHPDDSNVHFRITEEQIFRDVFHYIDTLFRLIQPTNLFFMAVDGVAPRAKMNQQRGRR